MPLVIGGIESKGVYTLTGNTNILHIINKANGIAENGSYRNISVLRNGNIVKDITNQLIHVTSDINRYFFNTNFIFIDRCEDLVGSIIKVFISTFASIP